MQIKICGITRPEETAYLNEINANYAGFVFYEKSKRNTTTKCARECMKLLKSTTRKVAVMVSPEVALVRTLQDAGFDILQIHKELSIEVLEAASLPVWYAFNISNEEELRIKTEFLDSLDERLSNKIQGIVVDAVDFGSGKAFDWRASEALTNRNNEPESGYNIFSNRQFILAGGLNPDNVADGIRLFSPDVVDVSSGVEGDNGKSRDKILAFAAAVNGRNA